MTFRQRGDTNVFDETPNPVIEGNIANEDETWTPTVFPTTLGNWSVVYGNRKCRKIKVGRLTYVQAAITFTPTFTTASGALFVGPYPYPPDLGFVTSLNFHGGNAALPWPGTNPTQMNVRAGSQGFAFFGLKTANTGVVLSVSDLVSGTEYGVNFSGYYVNALPT